MLMQRLSRYFSVGIVNTLLHWAVFLLLNLVVGLTQSWSNLLAFLVAVTFSFFVNAQFTFNVKATPFKYLLFTSAMGVISFSVGALADMFYLPVWVTLVVFSGLSFVLGFAFSNWVVFKVRK